jgi:hypothetical protein
MQTLATCIAESQTRNRKADYPVSRCLPDHVQQDVAVALVALVSAVPSIEDESCKVT